MAKEEGLVILGMMDIHEGVVNIGDPCYHGDKEIENLKLGQWVGVSERRDAEDDENEI